MAAASLMMRLVSSDGFYLTLAYTNSPPSQDHPSDSLGHRSTSSYIVETRGMTVGSSALPSSRV